jgi:hypothetical protein
VKAPVSSQPGLPRYNNAQHSTEVGTFVINCSGEEFRSGETTAYDTYNQSTCVNHRLLAGQGAKS